LFEHDGTFKTMGGCPDTKSSVLMPSFFGLPEIEKLALEKYSKKLECSRVLHPRRCGLPQIR
jgi:hypothetical protein